MRRRVSLIGDEPFAGAFTVILERAAEISGQVVDGHHCGVADARLAAYPCGAAELQSKRRFVASSVAEPDGRFRLGVAPGLYEVVARFPSATSGPYEAVADPVEAPCAGVTLVLEGLGGSPGFVACRVKLLSSRGQRVAPGELKCFLGKKLVRSARYEWGSEYSLMQLPRDRYAIVANVPGHAVQEFAVDLRETPATHTAELALSAGCRLLGTVVCASVGPSKLGDIVVRLLDADTGKLTARAAPDRTGAFEISGIQPGDYLLSVEPDLTQAPMLMTSRPIPVSVGDSGASGITVPVEVGQEHWIYVSHIARDGEDAPPKCGATHSVRITDARGRTVFEGQPSERRDGRLLVRCPLPRAWYRFELSRDDVVVDSVEGVLSPIIKFRCAAAPSRK